MDIRTNSPATDAGFRAVYSTPARDAAHGKQRGRIVSVAPSEEDEGIDDARSSCVGSTKSHGHLSFARALAEPIKNLVVTAYASRGKLARDMKGRICVVGGAVVSMPGRALKVVRNEKLHALLREIEDPEAFAAVFAGTGTALCLGSAGAVLGTAVGLPCGTALGGVLALLTFGISIPVGGVLGSIAGLGLGLVTGLSAGFVGGATTGYIVALHRHEIRKTAAFVAETVNACCDTLVVKPVTKVKRTTRRVTDKVRESADYTKESALSMGRRTRDVACNRAVQVTVAGGGAGAVALGGTGAACGALSGSVAGALIGLVPALFTFGLSIPIGAVLGGVTGGAAGAAMGGVTGVVGGASCGYAGYFYCGEPGAVISQATDSTATVAEESKERMSGPTVVEITDVSSLGGTN